MKLASPEALLALSVGVALVPLLVSIGTCYLKFSIVRVWNPTGTERIHDHGALAGDVSRCNAAGHWRDG
jgi:type III secretory pathway component EscR